MNHEAVDAGKSLIPTNAVPLVQVIEGRGPPSHSMSPLGEMTRKRARTMEPDCGPVDRKRFTGGNQPAIHCVGRGASPLPCQGANRPALQTPNENPVSGLHAGVECLPPLKMIQLGNDRGDSLDHLTLGHRRVRII
jgi:hypothetical protein